MKLNYGNRAAERRNRGGETGAANRNGEPERRTGTAKPAFAAFFYLLTLLMTAACNKSETIESPGADEKKAFSDRVYEFMPAPGQFVNEGYRATSMDEACAYAQGRLAQGRFVSLGGFGGYIVVGFDHSVANASGRYDFAIRGNQFAGSSEPGVVWVMCDDNGNGLPDDTWYELRGSETDAASTVRNYSVTYRRAADGGDIAWEDNAGGSGIIGRIKTRPQDYYPAWVATDSYTLSGTCLGLRNEETPATGHWDNKAYRWGYADNFGEDMLSGNGAYAAGAGAVYFEIDNATDARGEPAGLTSIDFIKVQTAVNGRSGDLGEISTEVVQFVDVNL